MCERDKGAESSGANVDESVSLGHFACFRCSFGLPSRVLVAYHLERSGMPLHDAVVVNCKKAATTKNQGSGA